MPQIVTREKQHWSIQTKRWCAFEFVELLLCAYSIQPALYSVVRVPYRVYYYIDIYCVYLVSYAGIHSLIVPSSHSHYNLPSLFSCSSLCYSLLSLCFAHQTIFTRLLFKSAAKISTNVFKRTSLAYKHTHYRFQQIVIEEIEIKS